MTAEASVRLVCLLATSALTSAALAAPVHAQSNERESVASVTGAAEQEEDAGPAITVTASRIANSFNAPTPTIALGEDAIEATAPLQVAEALELLPSFNAARQTTSTALFANLRNIGASRTLVLVDGRRHVPTTTEGTFDLNLIPANLLQRSEIVTGGASASWGSDAVAGVINLILKTDFEGLEVGAQAGISERGDRGSYGGYLTAGTSFADGRGRILAGGEYTKEEGVPSLQPPYFSRPWFGRGSVSNPSFASNGQPAVIYAEDTRRADTSAGGLITSGPLAGMTFTPEGALRPFGYGALYGNTMIGGTDNAGETLFPGGDLAYPNERYSALVHAEYDLTDSLTLFVEGSYAHVIAAGTGNALRLQGDTTAPDTCSGGQTQGRFGGVLIGIDNPYLQPGVVDAMQDAGASCIEVGRTLRDIGNLRFSDGTDNVWRGVVGVEGYFGGGWTFDAYYQYGQSQTRQTRIGNLLLNEFALAVDAVRAPDGSIACRSTLTDPGNGCVPLNILGEGNYTPEAADYITGTSLFVTDIEQHVISAAISGRPFDTWAGPVGVAFGAEYREDKLVAEADARSMVDAFQTGNRKSTAGNVHVKEVFAEANVPLAEGATFAELLEINGAIRYAKYSSSGGVTTWKLGAVWEMFDGLQVRATRSRDIRAGNIGELFTPQATTLRNIRHPLSGIQGPATVVTTGNRTIGPEKANTWTAGVQFRPDFLPGTRFSVDYFNISIDDVIGAIAQQDVVDGCVLDNNAELCQLVTISGTGSQAQVTRVVLQQLNLNQFETAGVDIEAGYDSRFGPGDLGLRVLATYIDKLATTAGGRTTDPAGQYTDPHWRVFGTVTYKTGPISGVLDMRWYEGGTIDNTLTVGAGAPQTVNINSVGSSFYTNATLTWRFDEVKKREIFVRVNNLFDAAPPFPDSGLFGLFDGIGRAYRAGIRFAF